MASSNNTVATSSLDSSATQLSPSPTSTLSESVLPITSTPTPSSISSPVTSSLPPSSTPSISSSTSVTPSITSSSFSLIPTSTTTSSTSSTPVLTTSLPSSTSTQSVTSTITRTSSGSSSDFIVTRTSTRAITTPTRAITSSSNAASSSAASLQGNGSSNGDGSSGLSTGAKTAIAVVIPIVVVAALLVAAIFFWRRRKQRKNEEEQRRKEMEDYGYNPNNDPTLPAVAAVGGAQMAEDGSGYRGWGGTATTASHRKASTTLSGGGLGGVSDTTSQPGGYHSPGSPSFNHDGASGDPLMGGAAAGAGLGAGAAAAAAAAAPRRQPTVEPDRFGAMGNAPAANQNYGMERGPSNASSSYSGNDRRSADVAPPPNGQYDHSYEQDYQDGAYNNGNYGTGQPIVRDVSARRNTRIENPSVRPQQGNSGIAQNF